MSTTLIVETEPETRPTAGDLLQIARQRNATMFFLSPAFENLPERLRAHALRDLVFHLRKSAGLAYVIARGSERKAEFLQNVATLLGGEDKKGPRIFDGLLLHDRLSTAPAALDAPVAAVSSLPLTIETFGSSVYWRSDVKFAGQDINAPESARQRSFFLAGAPARTDALAQNCAAPVNPRSIAPALRALFVALDDWVEKGVAPPASRIPRVADHTLIAAREAHWPKLPNLNAPSLSEDRLVPAIDLDGNEIAGLRLPDQAVPLGAFTGWNERKDKAGAPCEAYGAYFPFASNKADREKTDDPRLSLQERYGLRDFYVATVRTIADRLVKERLLLKQDADAYVASAKKAPF